MTYEIKGTLVIKDDNTFEFEGPGEFPILAARVFQWHLKNAKNEAIHELLGNLKNIIDKYGRK